MRIVATASVRAAFLACALVYAAPASAQGLPESSLAVLVGDEWRTWWRAAEAPRRWTGSLLADVVQWRTVHDGMEIAELELAANAPAWRVRVVLVRLDPARFRLALDTLSRAAGMRGAWSIDEAPDDAVLALNAGQFTGAQPWGWLVRERREVQPPGTGPLSMALVVDTNGGARLIPIDSIARARADGAVAAAFQSYPMLLRDDGAVPAPLLAPERGVDLTHRDARQAVGELRDGRLLIALTRFAALGTAGGSLPFGPTTPEMAALMGALGCREAMLLDGGLSAQLLVRDAQGDSNRWPGWRRVPLALVAFPLTSALQAAR